MTSNQTSPWKPSVLVICAGNTCRSPMAAAVLQQQVGSGVLVESAGVSATVGCKAAEHAVTLLSARGVDLGEHRSRHVDSIDLRSYDVVVAVEPRIASMLRQRGVGAERIVTLTVNDPFHGSLDDYRTALMSIEQQVAGDSRLMRVLATAAQP